MTVNEVGNFISQYGFPIVCCVALFWQNNTIIKRMTDSINNNTDVMQKLLDKIDADSSNE